MPYLRRPGRRPTASAPAALNIGADALGSVSALVEDHGRVDRLDAVPAALTLLERELDPILTSSVADLRPMT